MKLLSYLFFVSAFIFLLPRVAGAQNAGGNCAGDFAPVAPDLKLVRELGVEIVGQDTGQGNIVALSPYVEPRDFLTQQTFRVKFSEYFKAISSEGWISPGGKTAIALPEFVGLYLFLLNEGNLETLHEPLPIEWLGKLAHLGPFEQKIAALGLKYRNTKAGVAGAVGQSSGQYLDKFSDFLLRKVIRAKASAMVRAYDQVFSQLAKEYQVTLFAGSIPLPDARVETNPDGSTQLTINPTGPIYNTAVAYGPDGRILNVTRKSHVPGGEGFSTEAPVDQIEPIPTPIGSAGVLICADSWFKDTWSKIAGVKFALIPEYADTAGGMSLMWPGYSLAKYPKRLNWDQVKTLAGLQDQDSYLKAISMDPATGGITEHQALLNFTAPFWSRQFGIGTSIIVPLRAQMLNKGSDNGLIVTSPFLKDGPLVRKPLKESGATWVNVYL